MGEYHDLYLILIWHPTVNRCIREFQKDLYYKLDPCHYFTSPGLSWDAILKTTGIKLSIS